jgi:hypothetical protein
MKILRELITPQRARELLAHNADNNRNPKKGKIAMYARDMAAGSWNSNTGETIKVDVKGDLIDGQNRMFAVIESGKDIFFDVAYDVPTDAMQVIDTGATRGAADTLKILGAHDRTSSSAIVRWSIMWDVQLYTGHGGSFAPTVSEVVARFLAEPEAYTAAAKRGKDCQNRGLGAGAAAGTAHYLFSRIDGEQAHQFFDHYVSGANLPDRHPCLTLRAKMARRRVDRVTRPEELALFVRAWNAFRLGEGLDRMMIVRQGKLTNLNFPQPK